MMEGSIQFCLLVALLFAAPNPADAQKIPAYYKFGYSMVLNPRFSGAITSIVYKLNGNLVAEYSNGVPLTYYAGFNGRTTLNKETGELEINNMSKEDIGEYVVEINNQVLPQRFEFKESKEVPKPSVIVKPLACGPASPNCTLFCHGDIEGAGDVTFYWKMGDGEWKESKREKEIISNEETKKVLTFFCRMNNTFSQKDSEPEPNPFLDKAGDNSSNGGTVAGIVIGVLGMLFVVAGGLLYWNREYIKNRFGQSGGKKTEGQDETTKRLTNDTSLNTINTDTQRYSKVDAENGNGGTGDGGADAGDGGADSGDGGTGAGHADVDP